ncbi:MAG TPA: acyloxyacyl hydrolase [Saprospiraceae bacterium]|nr:acyloxyacyl hydrolase [Saprospiraceae bacterium]
MSIDKVICTVILCYYSFQLFGQNNDRLNYLVGLHSIQVQGQYGYVFPTNSFVNGLNIENEKINKFQAYSIRYEKQTDGDKEWQRYYNFPKWGGGLYVADFFERENIGIPIAAFMFFNGPFKRWNHFSLNYELALGMAFNWKSFDPNSNAYNVALGASQSVFIDVGMDLRFYCNSLFDVGLGYSLTHFSNGALKKPNQGLNTIAPKLSIIYHLDHNKIRIEPRPAEKLDKENEWIISVFGGATNILFDSVNVAIEEKYRGAYFPVIGFNVLRNWQVSYKSRIGAGLTYAYNGAINAQVAIKEGVLEPSKAPFFEKNELSLNLSYELVVNRVSMIIQPSYYLYRKEFKNQTPTSYQIIGVKYYIVDDLFVGISLHAHAFHVSDFIMWRIGYRFKN